jgi:primosomal protein N'
MDAIRETGLEIRVAGPCQAPIYRIKGMFRWQILLWGKEKGDPQKVLRIALSKFRLPVDMQIEVDPVTII